MSAKLEVEKESADQGGIPPPKEAIHVFVEDGEVTVNLRLEQPVRKMSGIITIYTSGFTITRRQVLDAKLLAMDGDT